jgi:hypothetical protein
LKNLIGSNLIGSKILKTWSDRTWSDRRFWKPDRIEDFKNLIGSNFIGSKIWKTWSDRRFQKPDRIELDRIEDLKNLIGSDRIKKKLDPIRSGYADPWSTLFFLNLWDLISVFDKKNRKKGSNFVQFGPFFIFIKYVRLFMLSKPIR